MMLYVYKYRQFTRGRNVSFQVFQGAMFIEKQIFQLRLLQTRAISLISFLSTTFPMKVDHKMSKICTVTNFFFTEACN